MINEIKKLYEGMGLVYRFPDLDGPLIEAKAIVHNKSGTLTGAGALKRVGEAFLWLDVQASTREKIEAIRRLNAVMVEAAKFAGLEEVSAWIPPQIEPQFAHLLASLGWQKSPWPCYSKLL